MRGDSITLVPELDHADARAHLDSCARQSMRHAVQAMIKLHVVVDADACFCPVAVLVAMRGQHAHRGAIDTLKRRTTTAFELLKAA